jgi:hypothetical protein
MLRFAETRKEAYGVDLDYVLDFIEYCNKRKASTICWPFMAEIWLHDCRVRTTVDDLVQASIKFVQEKGSRSVSKL